MAVNKFQKQLLLSLQGKACSQLTFCPPPKKPSHAKICSVQPLSAEPSHPMKGFLPEQHLPGCFHSAQHQNLSTPNSAFTNFQLRMLLERERERAHACSLLSPWLVPNKISAQNLVSNSGHKIWSQNLVTKSDLNLVYSQLAFCPDPESFTRQNQPAPSERVA